jgi:N-acetylglucosaminyldiphosphoundecaprenol N-acetyl-beta-D-mannosaminyltransferase
MLASMPAWAPDETPLPCVAEDDCGDDLSREVYCVLGIAIDAIEMPAVLHRIRAAAATAAPFVVSTPNLHFLVLSLTDREFRETVLDSDLCPADGIPVVWIARLMGIPIKGRIAGSDIFQALKIDRSTARPVKVFLFGGAEGVAEAASRALNLASGGLTCVGWVYPGFGTVAEMSADSVIDRINESDADFLVASLGAEKGQRWLQRNHHRLRIPIRAHLGATLNFQAGTVRRAPPILRKLGLEWLWRIKEEPHLWARYWHDGTALLRLLLTRVLPLAVATRWAYFRARCKEEALFIKETEGSEAVTITVVGDASAQHVDKAILCFRRALKAKKQVIVDFSATRVIDARFLGLLLLLRKQLKLNGAGLRFTGTSPRLERLFRLHGADFLLSTNSLELTSFGVATSQCRFSPLE